MTDQKWVERRFPTKRARELADEALDEIPESEPLSRFIDRWLEVYREHGGVERRD